MRTELVRPVARVGPQAVEHARAILAGLDMVALTNRLLDAAATLVPSELRTPDAIHLAAAQATGNTRMCDAAGRVGLPVAAPGRR